MISWSFEAELYIDMIVFFAFGLSRAVLVNHSQCILVGRCLGWPGLESGLAYSALRDSRAGSVARGSLTQLYLRGLAAIAVDDGGAATHC